MKISEFYKRWKPNHRTEDCQNNEQFKIQLQSLIDSKWISVADELPKEDGQILVHNKECGSCIVTYSESIKDWGTITHWQPLPKPPKTSNKEIIDMLNTKGKE